MTASVLKGAPFAYRIAADESHNQHMAHKTKWTQGPLPPGTYLLEADHSDPDGYLLTPIVAGRRMDAVPLKRSHKHWLLYMHTWCGPYSGVPSLPAYADVSIESGGHKITWRRP